VIVRLKDNLIVRMRNFEGIPYFFFHSLNRPIAQSLNASIEGESFP